MRVIDIEDVVLAMRNQTQFVLRCEEVFHDKISAAAAAILSAQPRKPYVCLTGPSGSGKTTTAMRLKAYLENLGVKVCLLSMDNFFLPLAERPKDLTDWESPLCVNRELLLDTIEKLSNGETVQVPWYDFPNNRTGGYTPMEGSREAVIIAEGIHMLNPLLFDPIRSKATGVYVAPRTRIITPGDRIIHPEQVRVARRMIRNYQGRGNSLRETILRAQSVNRGEQQYILPNKPNASIHIDSFHDYELCILAKYLRRDPAVCRGSGRRVHRRAGPDGPHGRGQEPARPSTRPMSRATPLSASLSAAASSTIKKQPRTQLRAGAITS